MRVIAGRFRGRPLSAPKGTRTRPTTDRVREALFQILGPLDGANVIDFFAGTGAMGIESLSRGATHATFVEADRSALAVIIKNLTRLDLVESATVLHREVARSRRALEGRAPYDLVLADPPWKEAPQAAVVVDRVISGLLAPGARVILGHPADRPFDLPSTALRLADRRRWGGSGLSFFEFDGQAC